MAELVDALDLGSSIARCGGSSPLRNTTKKRKLMKQERANLEFDVVKLDGCCGVSIVLEFMMNFDYSTYDIAYKSIKALKEDFKTQMKIERVGMLIATTALQAMGKGLYGDKEELMIESKLKASGWKQAHTCINPNTDNKITLWVFK